MNDHDLFCDCPACHMWRGCSAQQMRTAYERRFGSAFAQQMRDGSGEDVVDDGRAFAMRLTRHDQVLLRSFRISTR